MLISTRSRKAKSESEDYPAVRCSVYVFEHNKPTPSQVFRDCAKHYWLQTTTGKTLNEVCDHNAAVALNAGRIQTATVWRVVKLLFGFSGLEVVAPTTNRPSAAAAVREESEPGDSIKEVSSRPGTRHQSGNVAFPSTQQEASGVVTVVNGSGPSGSSSVPTSSNERGVSDTSGGVSEEAESEVEDVDSQVLNFQNLSRLFIILNQAMLKLQATLSHIASGSHFNTSDFFFGDAEADVLNDFQINGAGVADAVNSKGVVEADQQQSDWVLPSEAFQPRHEIKDRSPPPEHFASRCFAGARIGIII